MLLPFVLELSSKNHRGGAKMTPPTRAKVNILNILTIMFMNTITIQSNLTCIDTHTVLLLSLFTLQCRCAVLPTRAVTFVGVVVSKCGDLNAR